MLSRSCAVFSNLASEVTQHQIFLLHSIHSKWGTNVPYSRERGMRFYLLMGAVLRIWHGNMLWEWTLYMNFWPDFISVVKTLKRENVAFHWMLLWGFEVYSPHQGTWLNLSLQIAPALCGGGPHLGTRAVRKEGKTETVSLSKSQVY